ncbi:MAG: bifunctional 3-deoxy-7-phosphoheptulonate synthase/chorismate mutase [Spirochaetota bacterium]|nr:MAG: bifunctional 3-deoxy-7-phosphoheptulonate synthase/chorismate mutase [Spirochaetota bacterium]
MDLLPKVAIQGEEGSFSQEACIKYWGESVIIIPKMSSDDVIEAVEGGETDQGLLPIENSLIGSISTTYDLLLESQLQIVGEVITPISHCLLAIKKFPVKEIKKIYSHPVALSQCSTFLESLKDCEIIPIYDTAGSALKISKDKEPKSAAIASKIAAKIYNLEILAERLEDYPNNQTRFIIIAKKEDKAHDKASKTSIVFTTLHQPGALYKVLKVFNDYGINLTKLESRPHKAETWRSYFYLDFDGHRRDTNVKEALDELKEQTNFLKILGSYPVWMGAKKAAYEHQAVDEDKSHHPLFSIERKGKGTIISLSSKTRGEIKIGGGDFTIIAGPCSVEGRKQLFKTANLIKESGVKILRGGAFKPRTSPYSFQGLEEEGLKLLKEAKETYSLYIISEVVSPADVELVARYVDILQVGARNMQNFTLLKEIGQSKKPVLLKRGMSATIKEFLLSAEYILSQGNEQIILCERGIRTFEPTTRNTLDLSAVPILKQKTHLPVFVDPSHGTGNRDLILPMSKAALVAGADGVIVEVHFQPDSAMSDGIQSLDSSMYRSFIKEVSWLVDRLKE